MARPMGDGDSDAESEEGAPWLLGFVEPPAAAADLLRHRHPSKVGGRPAWLDPLRLPAAEQLACAGAPGRFLLQVYAPLEDNPAAFHRSVYLFIAADGGRLAAPGGARALRCQLPRANAHYPARPPGAGDAAPPPLAPAAAAAAAAADPWRAAAHEAAAAGGAPPPPAAGPRLFPELELLVEPEPEDDGAGLDAGAAALLAQYKARAAAEGEYDDQELPPEVVDSIEAGATAEQRAFAAFSARVAREPAQVLRYRFDARAAPLAPGVAPPPPPPAVPPCGRCGGPRYFEFQVMPQLLNHLALDASDPEAPDWGAVAVYSCAASCAAADADVAGGSAYVEEYVWVQPGAS